MRRSKDVRTCLANRPLTEKLKCLTLVLSRLAIHRPNGLQHGHHAIKSKWRWINSFIILLLASSDRNGKKMDDERWAHVSPAAAKAQVRAVLSLGEIIPSKGVMSNILLPASNHVHTCTYRPTHIHEQRHTRAHEVVEASTRSGREEFAHYVALPFAFERQQTVISHFMIVIRVRCDPGHQTAPTHHVAIALGHRRVARILAQYLNGNQFIVNKRLNSNKLVDYYTMGLRDWSIHSIGACLRGQGQFIEILEGGRRRGDL